MGERYSTDPVLNHAVYLGHQKSGMPIFLYGTEMTMPTLSRQIVSHKTVLYARSFM